MCHSHCGRQDVHVGKVLRPEKSTTVSASDGVHISAESNVQSATTLEPDFSFFMPVVKEATEVTTNSFVANWNALEGATEYIINVYDRNNAGEIIQTIDFSNGLESFPEGWVTNCNSLIMTEGTFGVAAPSLRMGIGGSYITSPMYNGVVKQISFWHKSAYMGSDNVASVTITQDGNEWEVLDFLDIQNTNDNFVIYGQDQDIKINENTSQFRIYFEKPSSGENTNGFLYIDDIRVVVEGNDEPIEVPGFVEKNVGNTLSCKVTGLSAGTEYMYTVRAFNGEMNSLESVQMYVNTATSIDKTQNDEISVYNTEGGILVNSAVGKNVCIYSASGIMVYNAKINSNMEKINLENGVYIVRCGEKAVKVVVM